MVNFLQSAVAKSIFKFFGNNWKEILLLAFFVAFVGKSHLDYLRLESAYETTQQSLRNQLDNLKTSHEEELKQRDAALDRYRGELEQLQEEYQKKQEEVDEEREVNRETIVNEIIDRNQFSENKLELALKVKSIYGFEYVP